MPARRPKTEGEPGPTANSGTGLPEKGAVTHHAPSRTVAAAARRPTGRRAAHRCLSLTVDWPGAARCRRWRRWSRRHRRVFASWPRWGAPSNRFCFDALVFQRKRKNNVIVTVWNGMCTSCSRIGLPDRAKKRAEVGSLAPQRGNATEAARPITSTWALVEE